MKALAPTLIKLHRASRMLEIGYADGRRYELPCEYLRVFSPSAELQGHGLIEPMLVGGKHNVGISAIEPVGQYAVRLRFDDGHDTGLYSWDVFERLGQDQGGRGTRHPEGAPHGRDDVRQRPVAVRRRQEAGQDRVRALSCSAKASRPVTASWPSAAAETRSEKSSEASTPV